MSSSKSNTHTGSFQPEELLPRDIGATSSKFTSTPMTSGQAHAYRPDPLVKSIIEKIIEKKPPTPAPPINKDQKATPPPSAPKPQTHPGATPNNDSKDIAEGSSKNLGISPEQHKKAIEDAYRHGIDDGIKQVAQDYSTSTQALLAICEQLNVTRETILQNSMPEMKELTLTIAEKIIRHSITAQNDTILTTIEQAIQKSVRSDSFNIYINSSDFEVVKSKSGDVIDTITGLENIVIKIDNNIEPGGCKIESDHCTIDATIASQLQIISDELKTSM